MKKIISLLFIISSITSFGQDKAKFLQKIISIYNKVRIYDDKYSYSFANYHLNSLIKYNGILATTISGPNFYKLNKLDLKKLSELTGLKISTSIDNRVKIVSWSTLNTSPEPSYSNLIIINNKTSKFLSLNETGNIDFGDNISIDTILDIHLKDKAYYALIGSNKCGNFCVHKTIFLYKIIDTNFIKCKKAFFDGSEYSSDIKFEYTLSNDIKSIPYFRIEKVKIISPISSEDKMKIIGTKDYLIVGN